jgi:hypothetical protein
MGVPNTRRIEQIAPLVATGLSVRQIAAETGIPISSVFRAKRQLEKARAAEQSSTGAAATPATKALVDQEPESRMRRCQVSTKSAPFAAYRAMSAMGREICYPLRFESRALWFTRAASRRW